MDDDGRIFTAAELEALTPDERRALFERRLIRDIADVPEHLLEQIRSTAQALAASRPPR